MLDRFWNGVRRAGVLPHQLHPAARRAVLDAKNEADRAGQDRIRAEHVLLGLLSVPGPAAEALAAAGLRATDLRALVPKGNGAAGADLDGDALSSIGIDLDAIRRATDAAFGSGALDRARSPGSRRTPFAEETRQAVIGAVREADALGQREISSGHLLLGLIDQQRNGAVTALTAAGADLAALRADVLRRIAPAA
jgi:ATP-dependent Clp protease ATP-binding subunit ClpA